MPQVDYDELIAKIPDFPKPGVVFHDVTTLLGDADGFRSAIDDIAGHFADAGITKVMGSEARGFMFGAPVAYKLNAGFIPARKPGKLPREVRQEQYELEYGFDALEVHEDALCPNDVVLIVDDLVATGGTAVAQANLVKSFDAKLAGFAFVTELKTEFNPRELIDREVGAEMYSLLEE